MFVLSGLSLYNMQSVVRTEKVATQSLIPATVLATDFEREILNARIFFIYHVTIQKPGALDKGWVRYHNAEARQQDLMKLVSQRPELNRLQPSVAKLKDDLDVYGPSLQATLAMVQSGVTSGPAYDAQVKDWAAKGAVVVTDAGSVETLCSTTSASSTESMLNGLTSASMVYAFCFAAGALLSIFVAWRTVRTVNRVLSGSVTELGEASAQIASAADQVAVSSQSLAQGSSEQAAMIEETSSVTTEINSISVQTTENSRLTAERMASSQGTLGTTNGQLNEMVDAMDRIGGSSQKISKIIKVIDEIAFQTNILALNAAVEAARAGDAGMGFAVVADEVRNLAQRCAQAARDTTELIEESIGNSKQGKTKVDQVALAIRSITTEITTIKDLIDEINMGSVEQLKGIEQITRAITQMEQVTQGGAANAEEGAAAAEQLHAQAEAMKEVVFHLKHLIDGGSSSGTDAASANPGRTPIRNRGRLAPSTF
jgi:methyl-accepting chemotaxis protein